MAQKLRDVINGRGLEFGATAAGKEWCVKALHPSEATVDMVGVPDGNAYPSFVQNFQQNFVISAPPGLTENQSWDFDLVLYSHPTHFGYASRFNPATSATFDTFYDNVQIGEGFAADQTLQMYYNKYRMAYGGVTLYHDAPALRNQGTLIGAQYPLMTREVTVTTIDATPTDRSVPEKRVDNKLQNREVVPPVYEGCAAPMPVVCPQLRAVVRRECDPDPNWNPFVARVPYWASPIIAHVEIPKSFAVLQNLPNAYIGLAREGLYCPFRMTSKHKWRNTKDIKMYAGFSSAANALVEPQGSGTPSVNYNNIMQIPIGRNALTTPGRETPWGLLGPTGGIGLPSTIIQYTVERCSDYVVHIAGRNIDSSARFVAYLRYGFEFQVYPGSIFASFMKTPPVADKLALETYSAIAATLKDGYPSEFNDFGKLLGVIKKAAQTVLPVISPMLGPLGPVANGVASLLNTYDTFTKDTKGQKVVGDAETGKLSMITRNERGNRPPAPRVAPASQAPSVKKKKKKAENPVHALAALEALSRKRK